MRGTGEVKCRPSEHLDLKHAKTSVTNPDANHNLFLNLTLQYICVCLCSMAGYYMQGFREQHDTLRYCDYAADSDMPYLYSDLVPIGLA